MWSWKFPVQVHLTDIFLKKKNFPVLVMQCPQSQNTMQQAQWKKSSKMTDGDKNSNLLLAYYFIKY